MGLEIRIRTSDESPIAWPSVRDRLIELGDTPRLTMIDGELAFPDEEPPSAWRELRIGLIGGMVTVRRLPDGVAVVVWGNADAALIRSWKMAALAIAEISHGSIDGPDGIIIAADFARQHNLII
jgi:hypothetical protein